MYSVQLDQFQGPLDLLLELIESEELDISNVSLAQITDKYLAYIHEHDEIFPEEMADFLVVAAKLLFLKSKALLPFLHTEEEEGPDLATQLKMYKAYLDASKTIEHMFGDRNILYVHETLPQVDIGFAPPEAFTPVQMQHFFEVVITRLQPLFKVPKAIIEKTVSLHEKIQHIQDWITRVSKLSFHTLAQKAENKTDIVVSFLALLELIKQRTVTVQQRAQFQDIVIEKVT